MSLKFVCLSKFLTQNYVHCCKKNSTFQKALSFGDHNWQRHCHDAFDHVGHILDDQEIDEIMHEVDPALHNIVLDTPPDMFEVWGAHFHSHLSLFPK